MPPKEKNDGLPEELQPLRTYKSDIEDIFKRGKTSTADVVLAEKKRREKRLEKMGAAEPALSPRPKARLSKPTIIMSAALIIAGSAALLFAVFFKPKPQTEIPIIHPSFINVESKKGLESENLNRSQLISAVNTLRNGPPLPIGSIIQLIITKTLAAPPSEDNPKPKPVRAAIAVDEFLKIIEAAPPSFLTRALDDEFVFGLHGSAGNQPFLVFKVNSFENTYAGMLAWEDEILTALGPIIKRKTDPLTGNLSNASSTSQGATSTPSKELITAESAFKDEIVRNLDVRAIRENNVLTFLYSFPDKETLVITNNDKTFRDVVARLQAAKLVR